WKTFCFSLTLVKTCKSRTYFASAKTTHLTIILRSGFNASYVNEFCDGSQPKFPQSNLVCSTGVRRPCRVDLALDKPVVWGKIALSSIGLAILQFLLADAR
ncbi:MAG: hypothetical protein JSV99_08095, partial [Planctomycetota bacterium]